MSYNFLFFLEKIKKNKVLKKKSQEEKIFTKEYKRKIIGTPQLKKEFEIIQINFLFRITNKELSS